MNKPTPLPEDDLRSALKKLSSKAPYMPKGMQFVVHIPDVLIDPIVRLITARDNQRAEELLKQADRMKYVNTNGSYGAYNKGIEDFAKLLMDTLQPKQLNGDAHD